MKLPFLERLQRLMGPVAYQVETTATGPEGAASQQALHFLLGELPDLLLAAVVETATGRALATYTTDSARKLGAALGCYAGAVRQVQASQQLGQLSGESVEEVFFTLTSQLHLLRLSPDGRYCVYLAVNTLDTNLGIARTLMINSLESLPTNPA